MVPPTDQLVCRIRVIQIFTIIMQGFLCLLSLYVQQLVSSITVIPSSKFTFFGAAYVINVLMHTAAEQHSGLFGLE